MKIDIAYGKDLDDCILEQLLYMESDAYAFYESLNCDGNEFIVGAIPTETLSHFKRRVSKTLFFIKTKYVKHKKTVVGMAWLSMKDYCFHNVYVKRLHRGKGIGKSLVKKAISFAKANKHKIYLNVNPLNEVAMDLYRNLGFKIARQQTIQMEIDLKHLQKAKIKKM